MTITVHDARTGENLDARVVSRELARRDGWVPERPAHRGDPSCMLCGCHTRIPDREPPREPVGLVAPTVEQLRNWGEGIAAELAEERGWPVWKDAVHHAEQVVRGIIGHEPVGGDVAVPEPWTDWDVLAAAGPAPQPLSVTELPAWHTWETYRDVPWAAWTPDVVDVPVEVPGDAEARPAVSHPQTERLAERRSRRPAPVQTAPEGSQPRELLRADTRAWWDAVRQWRPWRTGGKR